MVDEPSIETNEQEYEQDEKVWWLLALNGAKAVAVWLWKNKVSLAALGFTVAVTEGRLGNPHGRSVEDQREIQIETPSDGQIRIRFDCGNAPLRRDEMSRLDRLRGESAERIIQNPYMAENCYE